MELNLTWITPLLAIGGRYPLGAVEELVRAHGIRHVVDVRLEERDDEAELHAHGIALLHLPTEDTCAMRRDHLDHGVTWVLERLERGERVFIHCEHGIGRSALLALCVLVARGMEPLEAVALAKLHRPVVSPSPEQLEAFRGWLASFAPRTRRAVEVPSLEALAAVAYRNFGAAP